MTEVGNDEDKLIAVIENVTDSCKNDECRFNVHTTKEKLEMDCLSVFKHHADPDNFYGVFHQLDASINNFISYLARSPNGLDSWETMAKLDNYSSQGKAWVAADTDDILFAYEASPPYGNGNNVIIK